MSDGIPCTLCNGTGRFNDQISCRFCGGSGQIAVQALVADPIPDRPPIVCLCGSTRFEIAYYAANVRETLAGKIVLTIGVDLRSGTIVKLLKDRTGDEVATIKEALDVLHLAKIALADEVLVLNVDGYIGDSTRREIAYAESLGKPIRYWEAIREGS